MAYDAGGLVQRLYCLSGDIVENKYEAGKMGQETSECPSGAGNANGVCAVFRLAGQWTLAWAAWKYVAYGMYYYVLTLFGLFGKPVIHCFYEKTGIRKESRPWQLLLIIRTFILVNVGMLLFRANSLRIFAEMFESMFRKTTGNWLELGLDRHDLAVLALGALLMLMVGIVRERGICIRERIASWPMVLRWTVYAGVFCAIVLLGAYGSGYGVVDPLYANF